MNSEIGRLFTLNDPDFTAFEEVIRNFLVGFCEILKLTQLSWSVLAQGGTCKYGGKKDRRFLKTLDNLAPDFIKTITNHNRYDETFFYNKNYNHSYYKLSQNIAELLNDESLLWTADGSMAFYGFEDPTFIRNGKIKGSVNSYERILRIYLKETERSDFEKMGVIF